MLILQAQFNREDFQVLPSVLDPTVIKCSEFRAFFRAFFQILATPPTGSGYMIGRPRF